MGLVSRRLQEAAGESLAQTKKGELMDNPIVTGREVLKTLIGTTLDSLLCLVSATCAGKRLLFAPQGGSLRVTRIEE